MLLIKLLLHLIIPLLFFYVFLFLDLISIILVLKSLIERDFLSFLWEIAILLLFMFFTSKSYRPLVKTYKEITKNHFLDTYVFPKELYEILSEKYPHLLEHELAEILEKMKEFYRFQIDEDSSIPCYIPSHVVDFAFQKFSNMPSSSLFFRKFSHNQYERVLPKEPIVSLNRVITVFLSNQDKEHINPKIFEIWSYCCKKEYIDPFSPKSFPSFFTLDKRLKISSGFIYTLDESLYSKRYSILGTLSLSELIDEIENTPNIPPFIDLRYEEEVRENIELINSLAKKIQHCLSSYRYCYQYQKKELENLFRIIDKNQSLANVVYAPYSHDVKLFKKTVLDNSAPPPPNLFSELISPILYLCLFIFIDFVFLISIKASIIEKNFFDLFVYILLFFVPLTFTFEYYKTITSTYTDVTKNYFLDTYIFPKELYEILSEKYPHLKKNEVEEVVETMKEFYRFQINKDLSTPLYMPSRVVDFACQIYFDMPNSSLFSKKFKNYHRILPKGNSSSSKELITVLLAGQYEKSINSKISEMWCYCCKKEYIDPFFPLSFPSLFTIDKRLKIPSGFTYELDEIQFRETHPIEGATSISYLRYELQTLDERPRVDIDYLAKRIQYYLGRYDYCHQYQREELEKLFRVIEKNQPLAHAIYGQYNDANIFIQTVLDSSAPPPPETPGCCSGASI